ncbi:hypothetical protein MKX34_24140 [Paenibacillus sp. FSL R5-0636]|uniref:BC1872 family protein n=1 Tax=Paenibacillus TaxID=44249 RepID=UPI00096D5C63|nr:hypothetical protein [Paenibacillus odorifer]OMC96257.1 hypothetical protein BJP49_11185 [Paenibacillus odorifer]
MKREEITAKWAELGARERDAWIAEAVFGWERTNGIIDAILPQYTTDISAAWALVDKSAEFGGMSVSFTCSRNGARRYTVETYANGVAFVVAAGSTAPEAIGLASIIAALTEVSADVAV